MSNRLSETIHRIRDDAGALAVALSYYDYDSESSWSCHGDRWFHAASTMKVAVLLGLFAAVDDGRFRLENRLHVRNRFFSVADRRPYRIDRAGDANDDVHAATGKLMRIRTLAEHMIATSSNLATNLLLDLVGVELVDATLDRCGVHGVEIKRGVEDEAAFQTGINNRITSDGYVSLFRVIEDCRGFSEKACETMLEILRMQAFRSGIPAGLPNEVRSESGFAHKTGDISTVAHDGGIVSLPGRSPYVIAILTEWEPGASNRQETVARMSGAVYEHLVGGEGK